MMWSAPLGNGHIASPITVTIMRTPTSCLSWYHPLLGMPLMYSTGHAASLLETHKTYLLFTDAEGTLLWFFHLP